MQNEKNQMYKKYLIKNSFWMTKNKSQEQWFVKHTPECGGIYARLLREGRGVEISVNNERKTFDNFTTLDSYLDRLTSRNNINQVQNQQFLSILSRKMTSKTLRDYSL